MNRFQKFSNVKNKALCNPELNAAYEALEPEFKLAESMIKARLSKKLTQEELAHIAGVTQTAIARLESGTSNPTIATINKVAMALGKELKLVSSN